MLRTLLTDVFKEFSSTDVLHDHEYVSWCGDDLVEFDDVRMSEQFEQLNLSPDLLLYIQTAGREGGEGGGGREGGREGEIGREGGREGGRE